MDTGGFVKEKEGGTEDAGHKVNTGTMDTGGKGEKMTSQDPAEVAKKKKTLEPSKQKWRPSHFEKRKEVPRFTRGLGLFSSGVWALRLRSD